MTDLEELLAQAQLLLPWLRNELTALVQPWRLAQVALIGLLALVAWGIGRWAHPRMDAWMRARPLTPPAARALVLVRDRLGLIAFAALAWAVAAGMAEVTWPSRSHLLALAAQLAAVWAGVGIAVRLIRNPLLRRTARWGALIFATALVLGQAGALIEALDGVAVTVAERRVSLLTAARGLLALIALIWLARWALAVLRRRLAGIEEISPSMRVLTEKVSAFAIFLAAAAAALNVAGFDLTSLAVFSGAIGLGVGFGLQKVVSNLVSGVILLVDKSIKPGDVISLGETFGWISGLNARYVSVVTRDGREYLIPNEDLITGQVVNWSYSSELVRLDVTFGVAYASDPHAVRRIAVAAAKGVTRVSHDPAPVCHVTAFGDSSVDFVLRFWIHDPAQGLTNVRGAVFLALWDAFQAEGIEIPFPQRDVRIVATPSRGPSAPPAD
ncbi:MAG: mechanosensitive ion channel family protein [Albimonas sp.]|uniref:mechanosensitive ion channel family protein n=1 Tax=Albimonas sp. TaxID=1872425 RepID=UPI004055B1BA